MTVKLQFALNDIERKVADLDVLNDQLKAVVAAVQAEDWAKLQTLELSTFPVFCTNISAEELVNLETALSGFKFAIKQLKELCS